MAIKKDKPDFSEAEIKALKQIREYKKICESNIVSILFKQPDLFYDYDKLTVSSFLHNEWKVYFAIGNALMVKENKTVLDEITINLYLEKHPKLREKYIEYGGYEIIELAKTYVKVENIDGYIQELTKWNTVISLAKAKFPIAHRLKDFVDMKTSDIYDEYDAVFNHIFINAEGEDKSYDVSEGLEDLIQELNEGSSIGLPYYDMPIFNAEVNGLNRGNFYLLLGSSGTGKSSFCRSLILPSILEKGEKICIMINEEDHKKTKAELLVWVANNIYKMDFQKYKINNGNFSKEDMDKLKKSAVWLKEHNKQIYIVPLESYTTDKAMKIIKKYSSMGVVYYIIDTFKYDATSKAGDNNWLELQMNSVKLYDLIKPSARNVCLLCTMQLTKQSVKQRCLTMESISGAKNVADVASGCYMTRWVLPDEYEGEKHELKVYKLGGKNKKTKLPVVLDLDKHYQLIFLVKNRFGRSNEFCIVTEVDLSRNIYSEVGLCVVNPDW